MQSTAPVINLNIPFGLPGHEYDEGKPLFTAYGCVLYEKETPKGYSYRAQNLETGHTLRIGYRKEPLAEPLYEKTAAKIHTLPIARRGYYEADRPAGEKLPRQKLERILAHVFHRLLPEHGYPLRKPQAELAVHVLDTLCGRHVALAEAEVGIGKTLAYLAAALVKRGRLNDFWFRGAFPGQNWADSAHLPVVVSTSSIALQNALAREYVPALSPHPAGGRRHHPTPHLCAAQRPGALPVRAPPAGLPLRRRRCHQSHSGAPAGQHRRH